MRVWFSGPRLFGGFVRPGISFNLRRRARAARASLDQVYIIEDSRGCIKIGVSNNPAARLATLQTGCATPLSLAWVRPTPHAYRIEDDAHAMLDHHRLQGEWFDVPKEVAIGALYKAAFGIGVSLDAAAPPARRGLGRWQISFAVIASIFALLHGSSAGIDADAYIVVALIIGLLLTS